VNLSFRIHPVLASAFLLGGLLLAAWPAAVRAQSTPAVLINELLASNSTGQTDMQGDYDDWIELYNPGETPLDMAGMYLTDDLALPTKWQFPANNSLFTTIPPHGYLVVWADNQVADGPDLHAAFKLSSGGDTVALFDRDGLTLVDSIHFGPQMANVSYGRIPDGADTWSLLTFPTPGMMNIRIFQGFVENTECTPRRGFYTGEIQVSVLCPTEGAIIYYTLDGSEPYQADQMRPGSTARLYAGPIRVARTTCLRTVATKMGWRASPPETNTYIFIDDVVTQSPTGAKPNSAWPSNNVNGQSIDYGMDPDVVNDPRYQDLMDDALLAIPSISLVTDLANLFDPQKGIFVNARNQGLAWERPVSAEWIYPDGRDDFQIDAGLRIRGGYSRSGGNPKHAFRLFFRPQYGPAPLQYPLFENEGVEEFECVDLRTSQNYSWSYEGDNHDTFVREVFSRDTQRDMGQPYTRSRYYHLYIDGQYWGLFQTQERSESSYAVSYFGGNKEDYDVVKSRAGNGGYDIEATDGNLDAWRRLWDAAGAGFDNDETYYRVQGLDPDGTPNPACEKLLDVDNLIDYMLCTYYVGDPDGPVSAWGRVCNNFYGVYNRVHPDGFKFFRHDAEHSLWDLNESRLFAATTVAVGRSFNQSNPLWLHTHLVLHPEYRMRFADRMYRHFFNAGVLTPAACIERFNARVAQVEMAMIAESARWGDSKRSIPRTLDDDWLVDINGMISNYFPRRSDVVFGQLKSQGWYPNIDPPSWNQHGGYVQAGFQLEMASSRDIYYTLDGTDPRLPEKAGQSGAAFPLIAESAPKRVLAPAAETPEAWKGGAAFDDSSWIPVAGAPGGIGYERSSGYESLISLNVENQMYLKATGCYVRIPFDVTVDPNRFSSLVLRVRYDDGFVAYLNGTEVQRAAFNGTPRWNSAAGGSNESDSPEIFPISGSLPLLRQGQNILAIHAMNQSTSSSDFLISASLEASETTVSQSGGIAPTAIRYTGPVTLDKTVQVKARTRSGSTWSALREAVFAVGPVAESLRVSEIMYHPADSGNPNDPNTEFIELTNIGAATINLNLARFTNGVDCAFPSFELPAGGYCLLVRDIAAFEARYGSKLPVVGQYAGSLNNAGERIELVDALGKVIHDFDFKDGWYDLTDGRGFSLTVKDPQVADANNLNDKSSWRPSARAGGSPGTDDSGQVPELGAVVINEVLANPAGNAPDWIELHNTTSRAISIGGWFLSDSGNDLTRYRIAAGTSLPADGYIVFYQDKHFGNQADLGCHTPFGLSKDGETVYLHSGSAGVLTGYTEQEKFDASENGVSLGRWPKSTGAYNFVALREPTPGQANAEPVVGPIVINEIMYHPSDNDGAEYVELLNIGTTAVTLYDTAQGAPWRFTDDPDDPGVELLFPADPPVTLVPGEYLLLVKDLTQFQSKFAAPADVKVLAWGLGNLADDGEKIQLSKPGDEDADGRAWIRVDRVVYSDGSHPQDFAAGADPWPVGADGQGQSLSRIDAQTYGNDPANWQAAAPSPGDPNP
jgi:hypothetical protein